MLTWFACAGVGGCKWDGGVSGAHAQKVKLAKFTKKAQFAQKGKFAKKAKFASKFVDFVALAFLPWPGGELVG